MKTLLYAALLTLIAVQSSSAQNMLTPATAVTVGAEVNVGEVREVHYYRYKAPADGIMDVTVNPLSGEVDLTVTHFSGSPAAESRRSGAVKERIALLVREGDEFLIRVISPLRRIARYELSVDFSPLDRKAPSQPEPTPEGAFIPTTERSGQDISTAVEIPLNKVVPVEAGGPRYFMIRPPKGFTLEVSVYPIDLDIDVLARSGEGDEFIETISMRRGITAEYLYLPLESQKPVYVKVWNRNNPTAGARYGLVARLRHSGITKTESAPTRDREILRNIMVEDDFVSGLPAEIPGGAPKRVLRLP